MIAVQFCAICTDESSDLTAEPLGRRGGLVLVCRDCRSEPARAYSSARGYDVPERTPRKPNTPVTTGCSTAAIPGGIRSGGRSIIRRKQTPGFLLVLVPLHDPDGHARDVSEARATFSGEPWAAKARYLGFRRNAHVFERPPAGRYIHEPDPIAPIEKWRVK